MFDLLTSFNFSLWSSNYALYNKFILSVRMKMLCVVSREDEFVNRYWVRGSN